MNAAVADGAAECKSSARRWVAVFLVAAGAIVAQAFGRFTYGVLLPAVRNDLDHSNTIAGLLGTINVTAYLIGTLAVAATTARFRLIAVFRAGFVFSLSGLLLAAVAPNAAVLSIGLFLMGIGGALIWIPSPAIAAAAVGPERRGVAVGMIGAGIGTGIVFAGQLSRVLRERSGDEAWRQVYLVELGLGIAAVIAILLFLRHRVDGARSMAAGSMAAGSADGGTTRTGIAGFGALRQMPGWLPICVSYAAFGFGYLLAISFLTSRLEDDAGYSESLASTIFTIVGIGTIFGGVLLGLIADRVGERTTLTVGFAAFAVALAFIMSGVLGLVTVGAIGVGLMFGGLASVIAGYVVRNTTPEMYGPSYAAATLAFGVAQMLAPQVGGALADLTGGFTIVFGLSIACALCGAVASSRVPAR